MNIKQIFQSLQKSVWSDTFSIFGETSTKTAQELYFGVVFSCIDAIANAVADVEWGLYKKTGNDWNEISDHQLLGLLKNPNKLHTFTDFMYLVSTHIDTNGNAFIRPIKTALASKNIVELRILDPNRVITEPDQDDYPAKYKYSSQGKQYTFNEDEVINILRSNPFKQYLGLSTIQMARYEGTNEVNSLKFNNSFYENGAIPGGVISTDKEINSDVFNKLKSKIKQQYEGAGNFFKLMFLTHGFTYQQTSSTQKDMEYIAQRKLNRDQILTIFKTPKSIVAVSDSLNKATAEVEYLTFMRNVVKPRVELIFDKFNKFLLPMFGLDPNIYQLQYKNPVPEDKEFELKHKMNSVNVWKTVNEIRLEEELEPIEGGDELMTAGKLSELLEPDESEDEQNPEDKEKEDEEKKSIGCQDCQHKEALPDPKDVNGKKHKEYVEKRNKYFSYKEKNLALKLDQHFQFLIRDIKKKKVKSNVEDTSPDENLDPDQAFNLSPELIESQILPEDQNLIQWKLLLFLLLYKAVQEIYLTAFKQLGSIMDYDVPDELSDTMKNLIAESAKKTSKSVGDTVLNNIKKIIKDSVDGGDRDLKSIKQKISQYLLDQKDWKIEQIARTEVSRAYAEAEYKIFKENGIEKVEWLCGATPCPVCQSNCGQVLSINKAFDSGDFAPPVHPNCTCMLLGVY